MRILRRGDNLDELAGAGVDIAVLYPDERAIVRRSDRNAGSIVLRVAHGDVAFLLTGDAEKDEEKHLLELDKDQLAATVLKVAHHGSCSSTGVEFLRAVAPAVAVISVGENDFGHPCDDVLARLADVQLYRTDQAGTVELTTDGTAVWVRTER